LTDLKVQIVQLVEAGDQFSSVAKELGVVRKSIDEWRAAYGAPAVAMVTVMGWTAPRRGVDAR
jgi:transposase-like protein